LCSCNHLCNLGDDFENAHAAKSAKKVVGTPGVITPMYAHPTNKSPKALHNQIFITTYFNYLPCPLYLFGFCSLGPYPFFALPVPFFPKDTLFAEPTDFAILLLHFYCKV
jgi:hypothetical protein